MNIEALIISVDEPQLEKCLRSVGNQTIPFSSITHINGVIPESDAFNKGVEKLSEEWVMAIGGDFILYENAVEVAKNNIEEYNDDKIFCYTYALYDAFLKRPIMGCGVYRSSLLKTLPVPDRLENDRWIGAKLERRGWVRKDLRNIMIGSHFDSPDEFQVFRRFYTRGVKKDSRVFSRWLRRIMKEDKNPMYVLAMKAMEFGNLKNSYFTSHNIEFDRKMFEEFNENHSYFSLVQ